MPNFEEIQKNILLLKVPFSGLWTAIRGGIEKTGILERIPVSLSGGAGGI